MGDENPYSSAATKSPERLSKGVFGFVRPYRKLGCNANDCFATITPSSNQLRRAPHEVRGHRPPGGNALLIFNLARDSDIWRVAPYFVRGSSVLIGQAGSGFWQPQRGDMRKPRATPLGTGPYYQALKGRNHENNSPYSAVRGSSVLMGHGPSVGIGSTCRKLDFNDWASFSGW